MDENVQTSSSVVENRRWSKIVGVTRTRREFALRVKYYWISRRFRGYRGNGYVNPIRHNINVIMLRFIITVAQSTDALQIIKTNDRVIIEIIIVRVYGNVETGVWWKNQRGPHATAACMNTHNDFSSWPNRYGKLSFFDISSGVGRTILACVVTRFLATDRCVYHINVNMRVLAEQSSTQPIALEYIPSLGWISNCDSTKRTPAYVSPATKLEKKINFANEYKYCGRQCRPTRQSSSSSSIVVSAAPGRHLQCLDVLRTR